MEGPTHRISRAPYVALAVALCIAAAAGIALLLTAGSHLVEINLAYTAGALLAFGLAALAGLSIAGMPLAWIGWLCVIVAVAGFGFWTGAIWSADEDSGSEGLVKAAGSLFVFSLALAQICVMLGRVRARDGSLVSVLVALTLLLVLATATLLTIALVKDIGDEAYFRITAVVAVLATLGTALVPLLRALRPAA